MYSAPHCDEKVLHAPGECWACDKFPERQRARELWKINYTGHDDENKSPCPATLDRPIELINRWHGNVAETVEERDEAWAVWNEKMDAQAEATGRKCTLAPPGWYCSLSEGHAGPCPTHIKWWNLKARWRFKKF